MCVTNSIIKLTTCQVLKKDPNYPKIRKEVLEKARAGIRVPLV